ncbi:MAG: hypothetical protein ACYC1T_07260 [Sulfuricaulis sp.]
MDISNWSISEFAAWWGAVVATLALIWNIVVALRSGARIHVRASSNMQIIPGGPATRDKTFISVTAVNRGTAPTTITHFCGFYTDSLWNLIRGKRQQFIVTSSRDLGKDVPYVLAPGEEWFSLAEQHDLQQKAGNGYLYIGVIHNQKKRPVYARVRFHA